MSFRKAVDLLALADMATARYGGVTLDDIVAEFEVDRRTAQRMTKALEETFPACETDTAPDRRKYWRLPRPDLRQAAQTMLQARELTALEQSIRRATRDGDTRDAQTLTRLRDRLLAATPGSQARRIEADAEALLEAQGFASRPGPRLRERYDLLALIAEALQAPWQLHLTYAGARDNAPRERVIEPYGLILGTRRYLVARVPGSDTQLRHFRLDRIETAQIGKASFARDPDFDLAAHTERAFGSFHAEAEYGEVVWRFAPHAAEVARAFQFHPRQEMTDDPDGALTVRFQASGHLEMAWHLYQWGDSVEVLAPEALRVLVEGHRRADFPSFP
ncbi:helix-turn-helix transcriptional regulator [Thetidibacter halocola]|uniref:WYL domain-containing protein n=1 Tax=Thetidibacter halocola TaxID=2827239 RepID=A0A8J7WCZ6_9RHOB|nr:WYL domain-containing protein [Thetidibacter halocola]MBS0124184.1 WYL domain-containing protein [Thetidibacter halocola]